MNAHSFRVSFFAAVRRLMSVLALSIAASGFGITAAHAQAGNSLGLVSVSIKATGISWSQGAAVSSAVTLDVASENGQRSAVAYMWDPVDQSLVFDSETNQIVARLMPGRVYELSVNASGTTGFSISAIPDAGYTLEIGGVPAQQASMPWDGWRTFQLHVQPPLQNVAGVRPGMATPLGNDRVLWQLALGSLANGESAGALTFFDRPSLPVSTVFRASQIDYQPPSTEIVVRRNPAGSSPPNVVGALRQVIAPQVCVDVVQVSTTMVHLKVYHRAQLGSESGGFFSFTGDPFAWYVIDQDSGDSNAVRIECQLRDLPAPSSTGVPVARQNVTRLRRTGTSPDYTWTATDWHDQNQATMAERVRARSGNTDTFIVRSPSQSPVLQASRALTTMPWGEEVATETAGTAQAVTTTYGYCDTDFEESVAYSRERSRLTTGGHWEAYEYYDYHNGLALAGQIRSRHAPFNNSDEEVPSNLGSHTGEVTTYAYTNDPFDRATWPTMIETKVGGTTVSKTEISYSSAVFNSAWSPALQILTATRKDYTASGSFLTTVIKTFREDAGLQVGREREDFFRRRVHSIARPDGTKQSYAYQRGIWNGSAFAPAANNGFSAPASGFASRTTVITGSTNAGAAYSSHEGYPIDTIWLVTGKSTMEVTIQDEFARVVRTESHIYTGSGWQFVSSTNFQWNLSNQLVKRAVNESTSYNLNSGAIYEASYQGDSLVSETDEAGMTLSYAYDAGNRLDTTTRAAGGEIPAITTKFVYDAAGHMLETRHGWGQAEQLVSSRAYDLAGRVTSESSPGPNGAMTTSYAYAPSSRQVTVTLPNGGTRVETAFASGRIAQLGGTAAIPEYYTYEVQSGGIAYSRANLGASGSARKREGWTDWLGRTTRITRPGFAAQPAFEEQSIYDATTGRLTKTTRTGLASMLYEYDALSQPIRSGLDLGGNNVLDLASTDRIADADEYFEYTNSAWWLTKVAKTYPTVGSSTPLTVSTMRQRLTGFSGNMRAQTVAIDADGNTTTQTTSVDRGSKTTTIATTTSGLSNTQTEIYVNGLPTSITRFDGLTYATGYDALGRRSTSVDPRTGATRTTYKPGSTFVHRVQDPAGNYVATYGYDNAGRVTFLTNADGKIAYSAYTTLDQIFRQWGDATYPVEYGYNSFGERTTMRTYRGGSGWNSSAWPDTTGTADTTAWDFDGPSGLLASKTDAAGKSIIYTYNVRGQTATRTWARGITTTYGYHTLTGELLTQTYSDSTPTVTYAYTRAGQPDAISDVTGTRSFVYNPSQPLRLDAVALGAFYGSRVWTRQYDAVKRPTGFLLGTTGNLSADLTQTHGYHATTGRFDNVGSASSAQASRTFSYTYNTGGLVSGLGIAGSAFSVTRGYEPNRNLLASLDSKWNATSRTRYDYTHNALGQRATAKQSGDVFGDFGGSTYYRYVYNGRGEVIEAVDYLGEDPASITSPQLAGRRFGYGYDPIGNRQSATRALGTSVSDTFTANALNQYTSRENDVAYVAGTAAAASTVAVTGGTAISGVGRSGRYWAAQVTLNNTSGPGKTNLTVTATLTSPNVTRTESRTAFLPAALQSFSYDDDGNLTGDGVWNYAYDAENRLITMTTTVAAVNAGYPNRQLEFKYDYAGRRVQKRSVNFTAGTDVYTRHLYDGNNLVAEFAATSTSCGALLRSYTWGLDLVGSLTATGGVGALVQISDHQSATAYFPTYDGNGNVASLLRASDGAVAAKYEYSPFGELLRCEGTYAKENPFRFSTKFTDDESGLVYYGQRYHSPSLGRFINRDPIAEQGGLNLYGFCGNDGVNHTDYLGYSWLSKLFKKTNRALHKVFRALMPFRALRSMDRRLERWEDNHYQELKTAAAVVASIFTYGAASHLALGAMSTTTAGVTTYSIAGMAISAGTAGTLASAAGGFAAGVVSSGIQGASPSDALRSGLIGAIGAGAGMYAVNKLSGPTTSTFTQHVIYGTTDGVVQAGAHAALYGGRVDRALISGLTNGMASGVVGGVWAGAKAQYYGVKALGLPPESLPAFLFRPAAGLLGAAIGAGIGGLASDWDPRWTAAGAAIGGIVGWSTSDIRIKKIDLGDRVATGGFAIGGDQITASGGVEISNGSITAEMRLFGMRISPSISLPAISSPTFSGTMARPSWLSPGVSGTVTVQVAPIEFSSCPPIDVFFPQMYEFNPTK